MLSQNFLLVQIVIKILIALQLILINNDLSPSDLYYSKS